MILFSRKFVRKRAISLATTASVAMIANAVGPIRQVVRGEGRLARRYLVIAVGHADKPSAAIEVEIAAVEIHSRKPAHQELSQWASFVSL